MKCPICIVELEVREPIFRHGFMVGYDTADYLRCPKCGEDWRPDDLDDEEFEIITIGAE